VNPAGRQLLVEASLLGAITALFLAAWAGQQKLAEASRRVEKGVQRERALGDVLQLVSLAESGQRGYVLVGDSRYLAPYQEAVARLPTALAQFEQAFGSAAPAVRTDVQEVERLSRAKFAEMGETLQLYRDRGRSAAVALVRTARGRTDWRVAAGWATLALLIATAWLEPWYAVWLLPLAAVSGDRRLCAATLLFCAYALLIHLPLAEPLLRPPVQGGTVHVQLAIPGLRHRLEFSGFQILHHVTSNLRW